MSATTGTSSKKGRTKRGSSAEADPSSLSKARKASMPKELSPQLCTLTDDAPAGDDWLHEIKFDGYRLIAMRTTRSTKLLTRNGHDWKRKFPPIREAIDALSVREAAIDGEAVIIESNGHTSFQALQRAIKEKNFDRLAFFVFDLLHLDGYDLRQCPLAERKHLLRRILPKSAFEENGAEAGVLRYSEHFVGGGKEVHEHACNLRLEGIIAKRAYAPYASSRSRAWLKVKCGRRQEFIIIGFTSPSGSRKHFGSLLLGAHDEDGRLIYTGRVGTGFNASRLRDIKSKLDPLVRKTCPADVELPRSEARDVTWVTPKLVAEVEFTEWTEDGRLRHPSFQGLRRDKPADEVRIERPEPISEAADPVAALMSNGSGKSGKRTMSKSAKQMRNGASAGATAADNPIVAGVAISSPDRVVFPEAGVTKLRLAEYYESIADRTLPFLKDRPISTVRCPQGREKTCFFQKHVTETFSGRVPSISVREKDGKAEYIAVESKEDLVTLIQFGVIELHPWGSTKDHLDKPDLLTFDLDPGPGTNFDDVVEGARRMRDALERIGLDSFLKLSGGKGLHVVVPIKPETSWDDAKSFCKSLAELIAEQSPKKYVATASKAKRKGRIFIDYLRNSRGATSVAPYAARARSGAPVSAPIRWDELSRIERPDQYTVETLARRLSRLKDDPWADPLTVKQSLPDAVSNLAESRR